MLLWIVATTIFFTFWDTRNEFAACWQISYQLSMPKIWKGCFWAASLSSSLHYLVVP